MKKSLSTLSLLLALIMLLGVFAACSGNSEENPQSSTGEAKPTEQETVTTGTENITTTGSETATSGDTEGSAESSANTDTTVGGDTEESVESSVNTDTTVGGDTEESVESSDDTDTTVGSDTEESNESSDDTDTTVGSDTEESNESSDDTGTTVGSDTEESEESSVITEESETEPPSIDEIKNGLLIENANNLANGVNAYFTDGKRTDFALENQNMNLEYALASNKDQLITSIKNKNGNTYIESTADVFVRMTNGHTFYASDSTRAATANLYRFGYYMYEARFEEQIFTKDIIVTKEKKIDISKFTEKNQVKVKPNDDGSQKVTIGNNTDPYVVLNLEPYNAEDYKYIQIRLKSSNQKIHSCAFYVWTEGQGVNSTYLTLSPSDDYNTYTVDLSKLSNYSGKVTKIRLDFETHVNVQDVFDIAEIRLVDGESGNPPKALGLNRSFFVYSDKMHHVLQIATDKVATEGIEMIGMETKIAADTVDKLVVKDASGLHYGLEGIDWDTAEYVGFDIKNAGIFGYILPVDGRGDKLEVTLVDGVYTIIQSRAPENGTIIPSATYNEETGKYVPVEECKGVNSNANDFFMGQRLYTDTNHDFDEFLKEAYAERNPLTEDNFTIVEGDSSYSATYTCPDCNTVFDEMFLTCSVCKKQVKAIIDANIYFVGYEPLRGIYQIYVPAMGFNNSYFMHPNNYVRASFRVIGDDTDRKIYLMSVNTDNGQLESAALLDENQMLLPVPIEVGKNFSEGSGERNLWNVEDHVYSEALFPMIIKAGSKDRYTILNLYQNWGQYPLKQVSWIQFYAPYYHLSTGVTETNCIVPYYSCKNARGLGTLPDHRAMSAPMWAGQPQHTSGGSHIWLKYTDANGVYSASENTRDYIDSYGPVYADVYMDYLSDDGNIKVSYVHTEFPQTDENRAFYEMNYEVLGDVSFNDFAHDFCFYDLGDNDAKGSYTKVGYLDKNNLPQVATAAVDKESFTYVLGDECPYFSFFDMPDWDRESTSAEGYVNLSFLVYNYKFIIGGEEVTPNFAIVNENNRVRISLDLGEVTLKAGDKFTINCIVMPWGSQEMEPPQNDSDRISGVFYYDTVINEETGELYMDKNVRDVRENTLLNPLTPTAVENCEVIESVFVPKVKSTNGKDATFTLTGGQNNVAVRVYGFNKLTVPVIQELVDDEWVDYRISSAYKPDAYGYAYYYDGYSVHYDKDGTYSYAFIVPMDYTDTDGRTFRVSCAEDFDRWPRDLPKIEIEEEDLPLNLYYGASDVCNQMKMFIGKNAGQILLSPEGYTSIHANGSAEAYFTLFPGDGGKTVTGQYFVIKYRLPETNPNQYPYIELWTNTENTSTDGSGYDVGKGFYTDGKWHVLVIDLASWEKPNFNPNGAGEYIAQYLRVDIFNGSFASGNKIDIEYMGMHGDLTEILELNRELNEVIVVSKNGVLKTYDADGNEIAAPGTPAPTNPAEGFNVYFNAEAIAAAAPSRGSGHSGITTLSANKDYVTLFHDTDENRKRLESYFYLLEGNTTVTGQYLVIRYRTNKPGGEIEIYTSTQNSGATGGDNVHLRSTNYLYQTDGEWHNVVIDLSKAIKTFTPDDEGKYTAKYVRVDLFNFDKFTAEEFYVDIAYIGFTDNYEAATKVKNSFFYDGSNAINATTGRELSDPNHADGEPITPVTETYLQYFNATSIIKATQAPGTGHLGEEELLENGNVARIHLCTDPNRSEAVRRESYFYLMKDNTAAAGRYIVIKYRTPKQLGSMQIYASTENAGASDNGGSCSITQEKGLFIGDDQWHIIVIDLAMIRTYTPADGAYTPKHLRLDLFNLDNVPTAGTTTYVDLAYIGMTDDYNKILGKDTSVENILVHDGTTLTTVPNVAAAE